MMKRIAIGFLAIALLAVACTSTTTPQPLPSIQPSPATVGRRIGVYEAMIRRLADPKGDRIYVRARLCSMLSSGVGTPCPDRLSAAEQRALSRRLADLGRVMFTASGLPKQGQAQLLLGPILERSDGLRVEGGSVCGGLCGSGAMYIVVPTQTGYRVTGTDDSFGAWIS